MGDSAATPSVTGPITGGTRGWPFGGPTVDLESYGYREDEYFIEGDATRFRIAASHEFGRDGHWAVEPVETAPYKTRIVVYRPKDRARFNGTVVVSWNNVTAGYDLFEVNAEIFEGGFACVAVTTQAIGVNGLPPTPMGLAAWDPERYGTLAMPSDDYSFDIFTQAARAVGPARARQPNDPMAGLDVVKLIATGASQSGGRLVTYINAVQPLESVFDGFLLTIHFGFGFPLEVGDFVINLAATPTDPRSVRGAHQIREDCPVPVMVVNSELESAALLGVRQPDTDLYRYWEVAGTSHMSRPGVEALGVRSLRDFGPDLPRLVGDSVTGMNAVSMAPVLNAAIRHLASWVNGGAPPPSQPLIEFAGEPEEIVRDEHGNAKGGVRLPQMEVPIARNSAIPQGDDFLSGLTGSTVPFSAETLRALYGDKAGYVARFEQAARDAVKAGVVLDRDVDELVRDAENVPFES
jgi:hypothetical protein